MIGIQKRHGSNMESRVRGRRHIKGRHIRRGKNVNGERKTRGIDQKPRKKGKGKGIQKRQNPDMGCGRQRTKQCQRLKRGRGKRCRGGSGPNRGNKQRSKREKRILLDIIGAQIGSALGGAVGAAMSPPLAPVGATMGGALGRTVGQIAEGAILKFADDTVKSLSRGIGGGQSPRPPGQTPRPPGGSPPQRPPGGSPPPRPPGGSTPLQPPPGGKPPPTGGNPPPQPPGQQTPPTSKLLAASQPQ